MSVPALGWGVAHPVGPTARVLQGNGWHPVSHCLQLHDSKRFVATVGHQHQQIGSGQQLLFALLLGTAMKLNQPFQQGRTLHAADQMVTIRAITNHIQPDGLAGWHQAHIGHFDRIQQPVNAFVGS